MNPTASELSALRSENEICSVCLKPFGESDGTVKKVRCGHFFHRDCLEEILKRSGSLCKARCPMCRKGMHVDSDAAGGDGAGRSPSGPNEADAEGNGETPEATETAEAADPKSDDKATSVAAKSDDLVEQERPQDVGNTTVPNDEGDAGAKDA